jgi:hypothetical protein
MSADFWLNLQLRWDLYHTQLAESEELKTIRPALSTYRDEGSSAL